VAQALLPVPAFFMISTLRRQGPIIVPLLRVNGQKSALCYKTPNAGCTPSYNYARRPCSYAAISASRFSVVPISSSPSSRQVRENGSISKSV